jgi:hypothetical protein
MSYSYRIFPTLNLVCVAAADRVTGEEVIAESTRMFEDPDWTSGISRQLCDYRGVTGVVVTLDDVKNIMALERRFDHKIGAGRQALVVSSELHESLCMLYAAMCRLRRRPQEVRVFRAMDEALAWIELAAVPDHEGERAVA